ncbi:MAG: hypothetical protein RQ982_07005 [Gammaproteobacteria bacterium]|nr:hypothetical protein [Gammaproteobacteria bacterium]
MFKTILLSGGLAFFTGSFALASTVIEIQSKGDMTTVLTNGQYARVNMSDTGYVVVDFNRQQALVVSPQKQQVMLFDAKAITPGSNSSIVRTSVNLLGNGSVIAGYPTQKYSYTANGKSCGVIYASRAAINAEGMHALLQAMAIMMQQQRAALGGFAGFVDDCTLADMQVTDHVKTIGVPMRTERNGVIDSEVKSIKLDVALPENIFIVPVAYKTVTMQDQIQASAQDMSNNRRQPQATEMMQQLQQMQQSGQMTPEMRQQMRRTQQMMRQFQQGR